MRLFRYEHFSTNFHRMREYREVLYLRTITFWNEPRLAWLIIRNKDCVTEIVIPHYSGCPTSLGTQATQLLLRVYPTSTSI
jgi:hypothetical protein